jgi:hypothetical protein
MGSVNINNSLVRHSFSPSELTKALEHIAAAGTIAKKMDDQLLVDVGLGAGVAEAAAGVLFDESSILYSAIRANKKLKPHRRATLNHCLGLPGTLDVAAPINESVAVYPREKKGGVLGVILEFGIKHRTAQDIVARIVSRHLKPRPFQYGLKGVHDAIAEVKKRLAAGYAYTARLDIKDFYGSFRLEKLAQELPLPHEVVEHAVVGRHIEVDVQLSMKDGHAAPLSPHHINNLIALARQGLPPGSGCSPVVAEFIISKLAWKVSTQVVIVNYCDDWLILASKPKYLDEAIGALSDAVSQLPGGHFELVLLDQRSASEGFRFLGHCFHLVNGLVQTVVDPKAVFSFIARLAELDRDFGDLMWPTKPAYKSKAEKEAVVIALLAEMSAVIQGWRAAFREADDLNRHTEPLQALLEDNISYVGVSPDQVAAAIDHSMRYHPADYALAN